MAGLTEIVASFVVNTPSSDIPEAAIDKAKKVIADTVGDILAGASSEVASVLLRQVAREAAAGSAPILATGLKTSPQVAALANGALGHALDYDDVLPLMPGHPSAIVVSALLSSLGPEGASGRSIVEAYIIGVEVGAKIGIGMGQGHYNRGWHATSTIGIFAALGALARLHRADVDTTRQAIGIACSMTSGVRRNFGTMTKPLHSGWAARNAVTAFQLASDGFTAAPDALEAKSGFFSTYGAENSSIERTIAQLGRPYAVADPGIILKLYPCCSALHRAGDGLLDLREEHGLTAENTESVLATVPPGGLRPLIYSRPETGLQGKFCMEYTLAAGILDGKLVLGTFTDEAVRRPEIQALLPRMRTVEDPRVCPDDPLGVSKSAGTRGWVEVQVVTKKGETFTRRVDYPRGAPEKELTWDQINQKFLECAAHGKVDSSRAVRALEILGGLEKCPNVTELLNPLQ